ncbi:hypothetical protein L208DRAFT_1522858 [Tricholoma matsutake]|nr:hypothetical protein L208DRAFT_1522858 [Tricholoma matsutake 945]
MSESFKWSSPTGHILCQDILSSTVAEYEPHDWQVEGVCQSLDGVDFLTITPTGSRKTSYDLMYILIILPI